MSMMPGDKPKSFKKTMATFLRYLKPYRFSLGVVLLFSVASTVFSIIGPKLLGNATTKLFEGVVSKAMNVPGAAIDFSSRLVIGEEQIQANRGSERRFSVLSRDFNVDFSVFARPVRALPAEERTHEPVALPVVELERTSGPLAFDVMEVRGKELAGSIGSFGVEAKTAARCQRIAFRSPFPRHFLP